MADAYRWAIDQAQYLHVEDCLVDESERTRLQEVPFLDRRADFSLSKFMLSFRRSCHLTSRRKTKTIDERIELYTLIMLFALMDVHFLSYLPSSWLQQMLVPEGGKSRFERAQEALLGPNASVTADAFTQRAAALGYDLATQTFVGTSYHGGRVYNGPQVLRDTSPVDVQLIGPFKRRLGLAESCRRLAAALRVSGVSLNLCDFETGTASAAAETALPINPVRAAHINILHINAEEVPEAIAFLPDCFSRSRTILVPYWELDRPARVHELGLAMVDEIWATTRYLAGVFGHAEIPVTHIGMSIDDRPRVSRADGRAFISHLGVPAESFVLLTTSDALSWAQRKNTLGTIEAFQAAFPSSDVSLLVKTRHAADPLSPSQREHWDVIRKRCEADPRIFLLDEDLSDSRQRALLAGCDCLVSLHRAEGLGLDILDALSGGMPVVATGYSGNMDFCDKASAWLVDYHLVAVKAGEYAFVEPGHVWAEPRLESAVAALRGVVGDEAGRITRAVTAASKLRNERSQAGFGARLSKEIKVRLDARNPPCPP